MNTKPSYDRENTVTIYKIELYNGYLFTSVLSSYGIFLCPQGLYLLDEVGIILQFPSLSHLYGSNLWLKDGLNSVKL